MKPAKKRENSICAYVQSLSPTYSLDQSPAQAQPSPCTHLPMTIRSYFEGPARLALHHNVPEQGRFETLSHFFAGTDGSGNIPSASNLLRASSSAHVCILSFTTSKSAPISQHASPTSLHHPSLAPTLYTSASTNTSRSHHPIPYHTIPSRPYLRQRIIKTYEVSGL